MAITETIYNAKTYLTLKKSIATSEVTNKAMYDEAGKKLGHYLAEHGLTPSGPWSVLYFTWDETAGKTDLGIAFPVNNLAKVEDSELSLVSIPECKASMNTLHGSYEGLGTAHQGLVKYTQEKNYNGAGLPAIAVEEYVVDPISVPNPESWVTNIYYLHN